MWGLTEDLVNELGTSGTLPIDMLDRIRKFERNARTEMAKIQRKHPNTPLFDQDDNGRVVFHRDVSEEDKVLAREYASAITYFDSPQGKAFKGWLTKSANKGAYNTFFQPQPSSPGQPPKGGSGQHLTPTGGAGDSGGQGVQRPASTTRQTRTPIPQGSDMEGGITEQYGFAVGDWINPPPVWAKGSATAKSRKARQGRWKPQDHSYKILGFYRTGEAGNPKISIRVEKHSKGFTGGYTKKEEWLTMDQVVKDEFKKTTMPKLIADRQPPPPEEGYKWVKHRRSGKWIKVPLAKPSPDNLPQRPPSPDTSVQHW